MTHVASISDYISDVVYGYVPGDQQGLVRKDLSYYDRSRLLQEAINTAYPTDYAQTVTANAWVKDFYDDSVIFDYDGKCYKSPYSIDMTSGEAVVTLGTPVEVKIEYEPVE